MADRKMGLFGVTSLLVLSLTGTSLFFGPALSARHAGMGALVVWLFIGVQNIYIGLMFSELVSKYPKSGGIYEYAKQAYGQLPGFLMGWAGWLVSTVTTSTLIVGAFLYAFPQLDGLTTLVAALATLGLLSLIAYRGMGASESLLDFFAAAVLIFILATIVWGAPNVNPANYRDFGLTPIAFLVALFFIIESYFGWESATFLAEETKEPQRTIPRALLISTIISSTLGIFLPLVMFGIIPIQELASSTAPLADLFSLLFGDRGSMLLRAGVFCSLIGSAAGTIISAPRLLRAMARDKLFIHQLSEVSEQRGTPAKAIFLQAAVSSIVIIFALGRYEFLISLLIPLAVLMYVPTFIALPILRRKNDAEGFSCPFPNFGPVLISCVFLGTLETWALTQEHAMSTLLFAASLLAFSLPVYLLLQVYYNPDVQIWFSNLFAYPTLILEDLLLPRKVRKFVLEKDPDLKGKRVLELGAGVGSLTRHLAEEVTARGQVYAVEASRGSLSILLRRIRKHQFAHVQAIHDLHSASRLHPSVTQVDAVFSVGMLGYFQDKGKILNALGSVMPELGTVCFVEWVDFFGFLPNPPQLSEQELVREFNAAGFSIRVEKLKGLFWNYLVVSGLKTKDPVPMV